MVGQPRRAEGVELQQHERPQEVPVQEHQGVQGAVERVYKGGQATGRPLAADPPIAHSPQAGTLPHSSPDRGGWRAFWRRGGGAHPPATDPGRQGAGGGGPVLGQYCSARAAGRGGQHRAGPNALGRPGPWHAVSTLRAPPPAALSTSPAPLPASPAPPPALRRPSSQPWGCSPRPPWGRVPAPGPTGHRTPREGPPQAARAPEPGPGSGCGPPRRPPARAPAPEQVRPPPPPSPPPTPRGPAVEGAEGCARGLGHRA